MIKRGGIHRWLAILGVSIATGTLLMGIVGAQEQLQVALGPANKTSYLLGEAVSIPGYADFGGADPSGASVSLVIDGPQATIMPLPIAPGLHLYPERNLEVAVTSISTTPSTLPSTLPFVGDSRLSYAIKWTPPTFLSPAPLYSLIPNTTQAFSIPLLPSPTPAGGGIANLPDTVTKFGIPLVGTPAPGQPAALPSATEAFPVPTPEVAAPEAGAPAELPALTEAFNIPAVPTPTPEVGAPANLPTLTEAFNIPLAPTPTAEPGAAAVLPTLSSVFSIPTAPTPAPVSGVAELPSRTVISTIPGDKNPQGLTYDGTSFYILVDGTAADEILKVNSSGVLDTTWGGGDGIVSVLLDGENRNQTADIAYLDSKLYVSDKGWYTDPVSFNGGYPVMVFNINGTYESYWFTPDWARFSGLHAEGTRLWGVRDDGDVIMKMSKTGASISTFWPWPNSNASAMAIGSGNYDYIYTVEGESIVKRSKTNGSSTGSSWEITDSLITGMTYSGGVLYFVDDDTNTLYKAQAPHGVEVTTNPLGLAYGGEELYILVDATPRDKVIVVNPADAANPPTIIRSFDAPSSTSDGLDYFDGFLWVGNGSTRQIKKLDPTAGNVIATLELTNPIWNDITGLGNNGTRLIGFTNNDRGFFTISKTDGAATRVEGTGDRWGYDAGTYRIDTSRAYGAKDNKVYEYNTSADLLQTITLATGTEVKGLTFIGPNLFIANGADNTIKKGSIPHGITTSTNPLALAYGTLSTVNTLFILTDGSPRDKIVRANPTTGDIIDSFNAPDDSGEGLTYLGTSLYYASNKDSNRRIYELNATTGAEIANFNPKETGGNNFGATFRGLGTAGTNLILSASYSWESCFDKINKTNGNNLGRVCADPGTGLSEAEGVDVAPDGTILAAKENDIVRLTPDGKESARWQNLTLATSIKGLTFVGNTLYIADDSDTTDKIYKATIPSGITRDPLGLAYGPVSTINTLFILVDAAPNDHILLVNPTTGALTDSYDAPNSDGGGLTYLGTSLYYAGRASGQSRLEISKLNPADGNVLATIVPKYGWGGDINEDARSLSNNGNDLLLAYGNNNCVEKIDKTNGDNEGSLCSQPGTGINGARGMEVASDGSIFLARDAEIAQLIAGEGQNLTEVGRWDTNPELIIEGLTLVGNILYLADDVNDKIYKASKPSGITNSPQDLAYDGT
ncbi:MAG: hypothetical protein HW388_1249, partial [Dehalococcoidia bacterium]|nr:hypothetical protein [Dehalococcoidia bacterium]